MYEFALPQFANENGKHDEKCLTFADFGIHNRDAFLGFSLPQTRICYVYFNEFQFI
jgi:hypothetical protein